MVCLNSNSLPLSKAQSSYTASLYSPYSLMGLCFIVKQILQTTSSFILKHLYGLPCFQTQYFFSISSLTYLLKSAILMLSCSCVTNQPQTRCKTTIRRYCSHILQAVRDLADRGWIWLVALASGCGCQGSSAVHYGQPRRLFTTFLPSSSHDQ